MADKIKPGEVSAAAEQASSKPRSFDDQRMEAIMGRLLQFGVLLAATTVLAGGAMYAIEHAGGQSDYRTFQPHPLKVLHLGEIFQEIRAGKGSAVIQLGILLLIATPICRVIFAVIAFALERDRLYIAVSLIVLAVLLYGMLRGG